RGEQSRSGGDMGRGGSAGDVRTRDPRGRAKPGARRLRPRGCLARLGSACPGSAVARRRLDFAEHFRSVYEKKGSVGAEKQTAGGCVGRYEPTEFIGTILHEASPTGRCNRDTVDRSGWLVGRRRYRTGAAAV